MLVVALTTLAYVRRAVDALSPRLRTPFILRYYHQISYQDIAQQCERHLNQVILQQNLLIGAF